MRYPQLLICEGDGRIAALLAPLAETRAWMVRQPRRADTCLEYLTRGGPHVVLLRIGSDLEREFGLLDRITQVRPETAVVVLLETEHAGLVDLAWDLGATWVLPAARLRERLFELTDALLGEPRA